MKNISDIIEQHLKMILERGKKGYIEIQRSDLAEQFQCVPSQINYVINTRFTIERGYIVESKRGGGGFIRIRKIKPVKEQSFLRSVFDMIADETSQSAAEGMIETLFEAQLITEREARIMNAVIQRSILRFDLPVRDHLRAKMMKAMLITLMYK